MNTLTIPITADDTSLDPSKYNTDPGSCMVFRAIKRQFPHGAIVIGYKSVEINSMWYDISPKGKKAIREYLSGRSVEPFNLILKETKLDTA